MDNNFNNLYKNKKVLVTGHTGFKGSWLSLLLTGLGARVSGYSLDPPTHPNLFESIGLESKIEHNIGDIRDEEYLYSTFRKCQPEFVFHLAAQPIVRLSYLEPRLTYETNVMGTVNILEAIRKTGSVRVCVIVTSDKCYENREADCAYSETEPMGGYDPYSSSKGCAELVTGAYRKSFFNPENYGKAHNVALSSVRAGNVIGGGDWGEDRLVPDVIRALSRNKAVVIRMPLATRPWQHVLEPLMGYLLLGARMYEDGARYSEPWNFGPDEASMITVEELAKHVIKHWGSGTYKIDNSEHPHEAGLLKLNASKARELLGWGHLYDIYEAIERTVNWYKNFYAGAKKDDLYQLAVKEITEYTARIAKK